MASSALAPKLATLKLQILSEYFSGSGKTAAQGKTNSISQQKQSVQRYATTPK
jgi:hypothetical protein